MTNQWPSARKLLTARQVAERLHVSCETVLRWTRRGELPGYRIGRRALRFREDELNAWIAAQATAAPDRGKCQQTTTDAASAPYPLRSGLPANPAADCGGRNRGGDLMPATQQGQPYRLGPSRWGLRFYDQQGARRRVSPFPSRSAALKHYRDVIEPSLRGEEPERPDLTLADFVDVYLQRHAATRRTRTIVLLRERLGYATRAFGDVPLRELERMPAELADWQLTLSERSRYGIVQALRQTLNAAVRWRYMGVNPASLIGPNPQPAPRTPDPFTLAEVDEIAVELGPAYGPLVRFAAATGLRPQEWAALERRDVDRQARLVNVRRTLGDDGVHELAKTDASRRQVPVSARALVALDELPARINTPLLFCAPEGGLLSMDNFRRREWAPALEASGVRKRRIYDLRSTFISHALAAGVTVFELARIAGTSVRMIERHYGALPDGAGAGIAGRLDALEAQLSDGSVSSTDEALPSQVEP